MRRLLASRQQKVHGTLLKNKLKDSDKKNAESPQSRGLLHVVGEIIYPSNQKKVLKNIFSMIEHYTTPSAL
jgi:hypothetical protein